MSEPSLPTLPEGQWAALDAAYRTPPRAYHDRAHVDAVLHHFHQVAAGPGWAQPLEVWCAVLYHDAIYDAGRSDNEARSADFAVAELAHWQRGAAIDAARVSELILLTARHGRIAREDLPALAHPDDVAHFLDSDMAILGAPPAVFDAYDRGIATEYRGHVPDLLFRFNRRRFLKGLLAKPRIFLSDHFHAALDAQARNNLRRAITTKR